MRILLDTHVFLWYISADAQLPAAFVHLAGQSLLHRDPFDRILVAQALRHLQQLDRFW
jgi:PIN domain nuclease of toxin-antitoxin system